MQELIFYVAANQPLGTVQNEDGSEPVFPPVLVRGVPVTLCARLFSSLDGGTAYPAESLSDITSWSFVMDDDFDPKTNYKVIADNDAITLVTATGKPPEVRIPISDMDSPELAAKLGTNESVFLTGELVGYNAQNIPIFALQIKSFSIRNRIMALEPVASSISSADIATMISAGIEVQYSIDGNTDWHSTRTSSDSFMRLRVEGGESWSGAIKIHKEANMPNKIDVWGHSELERDYMVKPAMPYEVDATKSDTGYTYIRYLNRDTTVVHRIGVSASSGREYTKHEVSYGAWADRASLVYESPENYPKTV